MKTTNIVACLGVLSACLTISSAAIAEENCSGYAVGVGTARVIISDDHTLPTHLVTGECHATGPGTSECKYKDEDGDEWTDLNKWTGPGDQGTWREYSGTGKFSEKVGGSGWYKLVRTGPMYVWAWGGHCSLADKK